MVENKNCFVVCSTEITLSIYLLAWKLFKVENKGRKLFDGIDVGQGGMVYLKDKSCSGKCKMFWEGHKIWKNLPPFFERRNNVGDFF